MATIDIDELLADITLYIRSDNIFTDAQIIVFANKVITAVGDDDSNYEEVLCKTLKTIAVNNKAQSSGTGAYKKIRTEFLEEEFYNTDSSNSWDDYLDSLDDICASFGYTELSEFSTGMMYIKVSTDNPIIDDPPVNVNDLTNISSNSTTEYIL